MRVAGKWRPLRSTHSVAALWAYYVELTRSQAVALEASCRTDWQAIPDELFGWIAEIEKADGSSTYFRYPDGRNPSAEAAKSSWKPATEEEILERAQQVGKPIRVMLLCDDDDEVTAMFQHDAAPLAELVRVLAETANLLSGAHTGLRVELAGGE